MKEALDDRLAGQGFRPQAPESAGVAQALAIGQLRKRHRAVMLGTAQRSHPYVAIVARQNPREGCPRQKSISCAKSVLPAFMGDSSEKSRIPLHKIQIDTTLFGFLVRKLMPNQPFSERTALLAGQ